MKYGKMSVNGV